MHAEAHIRLGDDLVQELLTDHLTRSTVERQLCIGQDGLRVEVLQEPFLRPTSPQLDSMLEACARMRDGQHLVAVKELVGCGVGDLMLWQGRLMAGVEQGGRGRDTRSGDCQEPEELGI